LIKMFLSYGDWGLGIGDWGLGPIPNLQSPIPNPRELKYLIILISIHKLYLLITFIFIIIMKITIALHIVLYNFILCNRFLQQTNTATSNTSTIVTTNSSLKCGQFTCPSANSQCFGKYNEACLCNTEWATFPFDQFEMCNYKKKKQVVTFLLEFFIPFGAGHLYAKNYAMGIIKLLYFVLSCCLFGLVRLLSKKTEENNTFILLLSLLGCITCIGVIVWQLTDIILIGLNRYSDGNGILLYPMTNN